MLVLSCGPFCALSRALAKVLDVLFVSPLVLPGAMAVHIDDITSSVFVTNEAGIITMLGSFEVTSATPRSSL